MGLRRLFVACGDGTYQNCSKIGDVWSCYVATSCPPAVSLDGLTEKEVTLLQQKCNCTSCPSGKYLRTDGATSESDCIACEQGYASSETGATVCSLCLAGTYATDYQTGCAEAATSSGATDCEPCAAGKYSDIRGAVSTDCEDCDAGYGSDEGASSCFACPAGTYEKNNKCHGCTSGKFTASKGSITCTSCETGYTSDRNATACFLCDVGYYDAEVTTACNDTYRNSMFSSSIEDDGLLSQNTDEAASGYDCTSCQVCEADTKYTCPNVGTTIKDIDIQPGYYRALDMSTNTYVKWRNEWLDWSDGDIVAEHIHECTLDGNCVGGTDAENYCATGYRGKLCGVCDTNYYYSSSDFACLSCDDASEGTGTTVLYLLGTVIVLLLIFYLYKYKQKQLESLLTLVADISKKTRAAGDLGDGLTDVAAENLEAAGGSGVEDVLDNSEAVLAHEEHEETGRASVMDATADVAIDQVSGANQAAADATMGIATVDALTDEMEEEKEGNAEMIQLEHETETEAKTFKQALSEWLKSMKTKVKIIMVCYQLVSSIGFNCDVEFPADCESG